MVKFANFQDQFAKLKAEVRFT